MAERSSVVCTSTVFAARLETGGFTNSGSRPCPELNAEHLRLPFKKPRKFADLDTADPRLCWLQHQVNFRMRQRLRLMWGATAKVPFNSIIQ